MTNLELITKAIERLEAHYPYEDESGVIKISLGKYMNAMRELRHCYPVAGRQMKYWLVLSAIEGPGRRLFSWAVQVPAWSRVVVTRELDDGMVVVRFLNSDNTISKRPGRTIKYQKLIDNSHIQNDDEISWMKVAKQYFAGYQYQPEESTQ